MDRAKRLVRLIGIWAVAVGGPGCAFLDPWDEDDCDCYETRSVLPADDPPPSPLHSLEPGVYRESR